MSLDQLLDEAFPIEKPAPAQSAAPRATGSPLDSLLDEAFGEAQPKPEQPGLLSRAASAVTSAVTEAIPGAKAVAGRLGFKTEGPAIAPGAVAPPKSVALPQAPSAEDLKATRESAAIPEPKAPAPPPVPIKIGPVAGLGPVVEETRRTPLLEQVGGPARSEVFKPEPVKPAGMLARGAAAAGVVSPEAAEQRRMEAEFAATSVMRKPEGMSEERWQVRQALDTLNRTTAAFPRATADRLTFGVLPALLDTFGIESPKTRAPQGQAEALATGAGELAGFLMGPAKASHAMLEGNILKWIGPKAGDAVGTILAKNVATQAANLGVASGLAHLGEAAQADNLVDAYREMGQHVKSGALLGAAFGLAGGVIPSNELLPRAARLGVGLAAIDAVQGTHPLDERALSQKAFDYGLNVAFLWRGQDPRKMQAVLEAEAKARSTKEQPVIPEQVLKNVLDKAQERAAKVTTPEERATLEADLKALFAQEVGDVATGTTATELRTAREVAEQKTGGPVGPGPAAPPKPAVEPSVTLPGGQPGPPTGPVMILGPTGRPMAAPGPARPPEASEPLQTAQERAEARAKGIGRPTAPARQGAAPAPTVKPETADRPVSGLTFRDYVEASGKRWPLTSRDPDFARLRFEFDDLKKGLYEARPGVGGQWAIVNRKTGEEVDHLVGGAKAQLETNRLNAVVTLDAFRTAQLPGPIRMEVKPAEDLAAKKAPEPKVEGAAAQQQQAERAVIEGPKPSAEPPAQAPQPAPPPRPVQIGKRQEIRVPAGSRYQVQYEIVPAEDMIPSHHPKTFAKDPRYPEGVQNRPYHSDKSEQAKVIRQGQDFEPLFLVSPQPSSGGTPIVAPDSNVVLSGNSRTMSLLRTIGTEAFEHYRAALRDMAPALGLRPEALEGVEHPILVRRLVGTDTTPEFYRRFAKETNEGFKQALNTQAQAVSQGQAVKPETMEWIAGGVDALGENASLRDFLRSGRDREIIRRFIQDGVFTERDLSRYIDPRTTQLNEDGKRLVERSILGHAIPDPDLLAQAPDAVVAKIERALGPLAKIKGRGGEWDLGADLADAIRTIVEIKATGHETVEQLRRQTSLLEQVQPTSRADTLADALLRMKPNDFKAALGRYADEAQRDVRGQGAMAFATPQTPAEAFRTAFEEGPRPPLRRVAEAEAPYRSGEPSGERPTEARRAGEAEGELKKSPIPAPPLTQAEPSQVSMVQASGPSMRRETAPSFQIREGEPIASTSTLSLSQPTGNVQELLEMASRAKPSLDAALAALAARIPGVDYLGSRVKTHEAVIDKMQRKPEKGPQRFDDYLGGRFQADSPASLEQTAAALREKWPEHTEDNFLEHPNTWGYRGDHLSVKLPNGLITEIQLVPTPVAVYQEAEGHKIYKRWRSTLPSNPDEAARASADKIRSNERFQAAYDQWIGRPTATAETEVSYRAERAEPKPEIPSKITQPSLTMNVSAKEPVMALEQELGELFAIRGGSEGPVESSESRPSPPPIAKETREKLVQYGQMVFAESPARSYPDFARRVTEKLGDRVRPYLPEVWGEVLREVARTQQPLPGGQKGGGKPPEPPKDIPQSAKPIEPAPGLTEPQLKLGLHKNVLAAAEDLFKAGKLVRDPTMLLSDQILDAIREGNLRIEEMAGVLDKHGMTFSEFGQSMFRPAITDAARRLAALSTLQKRIRDLEVELGGPEPKGGKPGGPGEGERLEKVKTLGDLLDAAKAIDPAAARALSWWRRADNIRRGLLVTQLATSVRNFTTQVGRLGMDVLDQGFQGALQRAFGKEVTTHPADSFRALMEALSQARPSKHKAVKARVDAILEGLPREQERLFGTYASDLTTAAKKQGAEGAIDAAFRGGERAVELLNTVNRFQEYVVRRSVFQAELAARLRTRGIDLEEAITKPEVRRQIPVADIRAAIQKSLEITFAENPAYGSPGYHFVKWVNQTPGLTFLTPFPRFMVNSLKFFYEFSPLGFTKLLSEVERQKVRQGDMQTISRATLGLGLLGTAYLIRAMQEDDTKWYEVRLPGMTRTLDTRAYNPFAAYLFVADLIHRSAQGRLYGGGLTAEAVKTFFGANVRGGTGLQAVDQLVDGLRDIGDTRALEKYLKGAGGHLIAGFLTPLQQLTDVYAEFSPEDQVVRDVKSEPFLGPIKQRFPSSMVEAVGGELPEEKASPTSEEPVRRESPGLRQAFGLTFGKEKNDLEKELDRLQIPYREVLPSQGDPRLDNILARHMGERAEIGNRLVNSSRYQNLGEIAKRLELKTYLQRLRKQAKAKALQDREYREVYKEVRAGTSKERLAEMAREERAGLR